MGASAGKIGRRVAPRFRFDATEPPAVRFVSSRTRQIHRTSIFDISETGMAFTSSRRAAPFVGELIKMDFALPGMAQMACLARVVRIEQAKPQSPWAKFPGTVKVGVTFHELPGPYQKLLSNTLNHLLFGHEEGPKRPILSLSDTWIVRNGLTIVLTFGVLCVGTVLMYYFFQYLTSLHPQQEAPWATGFFKHYLNR